MVHSYPEGERRHCGTSSTPGRHHNTSQESGRWLAVTGSTRRSVAKWRKRCSVTDLGTVPKDHRSTVLTAQQEAVVVAFRRHWLLPLDDCLYASPATIPYLPVPRCIAVWSGMASAASRRWKAASPKERSSSAIRWLLYIDFAEMHTAEGKLSVLWPPTTPRSSLRWSWWSVPNASCRGLSGSAHRCCSLPLYTVLTDNGIQFADLPRNRRGPAARWNK